MRSTHRLTPGNSARSISIIQAALTQVKFAMSAMVYLSATSQSDVTEQGGAPQANEAVFSSVKGLALTCGPCYACSINSPWSLRRDSRTE